MAVDINYWWIGVLLLALILFIAWVIKRNRKDEKNFEKGVVNSGRRSSKHKQNKYNITTP
jgi:flagellar biogenesis protein FliO